MSGCKPKGVLEVSSTNKGVLFTRLALTAANIPAPLTAHVAGMILYNTSTAGISPNQVTPGYYYNDGTRWVRLTDKYQAEHWYNVANNLPADANTQNIYQTGNVGIFTNPSIALHVKPAVIGDDPLRIEGLRPAIGTEKKLLADASGIIRVSTETLNSLFYANLKADQIIDQPTTTTYTILIYDTPVSTSSLYSYDMATGIMTFSEAGNYLITMQAAFSGAVEQQQFLLGVRSILPTDVYVARGSSYAAMRLHLRYG